MDVDGCSGSDGRRSCNEGRGEQRNKSPTNETAHLLMIHLARAKAGHSERLHLMFRTRSQTSLFSTTLCWSIDPQP
jgi:hypothetical protein